MMKKLPLVFGSLVLAGCNATTPTGSGSMTVFLANRADLSATCEAASADGSSKTEAGSDGSVWRWTKAEGQLGMIYCQTSEKGVLTTWQEASGNQGATHSLKFESNDSPALFQMISK